MPSFPREILSILTDVNLRFNDSPFRRAGGHHGEIEALWKGLHKRLEGPRANEKSGLGDSPELRNCGIQAARVKPELL